MLHKFEAIHINTHNLHPDNERVIERCNKWPASEIVCSAIHKENLHTRASNATDELSELRVKDGGGNYPKWIRNRVEKPRSLSQLRILANWLKS